MDFLLKSGEALMIKHNLFIADELKLLKNLKLNFISHSRNINTEIFFPLAIGKAKRKKGGSVSEAAFP